MENERFIAASTQCFVYIFFSSDGIMCSIYVNYNIAVMALVCVISFHFARKGLCLVILNINRRQVANCSIVFDGLVQLLPFKIKENKKVVYYLLFSHLLEIPFVWRTSDP